MNYSKMSCCQRQHNPSGCWDAAHTVGPYRAAFKTHRLILSVLALLALAAAPALRAADRATVQAILIIASKEPGQTDRRLAPYESNLRRILRFESFKFVAEGSASLNVPGEGRIGLGRGQSVSLEAESSDGRSLRVKVSWLSIETGLALRPGVPAILGGPSTGDGDDVYALLVIGR